MKPFGLVVTCFTAVQAWQVVLWGESGCKGASHSIQDAPPCRQPGSMPADFDAKSMQVVNVPAGYNVTAFTDNNTGCSKITGSFTWMFWSADGGVQCHDLDPNKNGKWRIVSVDSA